MERRRMSEDEMVRRREGGREGEGCFVPLSCICWSHNRKMEFLSFIRVPSSFLTEKEKEDKIM